MNKIAIAGLIAASALSTHAIAANLTAYTTEWQIYGNENYPGYLYDGSYDQAGAYNSAAFPLQMMR